MQFIPVHVLPVWFALRKNKQWQTDASKAIL
jgi:hypothetical protein